MSRLRVGVIGVGIGRTHLKGYRELSDEVEITALCDLDEARLKAVGDKFHIPLRYTDFRDLIASQHVDAVSICVPNNLHVPASMTALAAGLHVLCEKPLAEHAISGQKIVDAAAQARGKFMVCYNRRYRPDVRWMKDLIDRGGLGQIYQVKAGWIRETGIPGWTSWFSNKNIAGGGPLIDLGAHMLDLAMWLLDYPQPLTVSGDVQARFGPHGLKTWLKPGQAARHDFAVEDTAIAFIRLAGDTSLMLETSWASHAKPGLDDFFLTLMGTKGTLELYVANYAAEDTVTFYTEIDGAPATINPRIVGASSDHIYAVSEFVKCIQADLPSPASAEDGLMIMTIIDAIYRSAEVSREVALI